MASLELARTLAALVVLVSHLGTLSGVAASLGPARLLLQWATEAVILFFVLSGLVVRLSQDRAGRSRGAFLAARARRLVPLYLVVLVAAFALDTAQGRPPSAGAVAGHLLFVHSLQGFIVPVTGADPALWSLAYEMFFYVAFACCIGPRQRAWLRAWGTLAAFAVAWQGLAPAHGVLGHLQMMLSYSAIWLLGYALPDVAVWWTPSRAQAAFLFGLAAAASRIAVDMAHYFEAWRHLLVGACFAPLLLRALPFAVAPRVPPGRAWALAVAAYVLVVAGMWRGASLPLSKLLYTALPWALVLLAGAATRVRLPDRVVLAGGRLSYVVYLVHQPVILGLLAVGLVGWPLVALAAVVVALVAWPLEYVLQPRVVALFGVKSAAA